MDTAALLKQARSGDKDALIELIMAKKDEFYRLAYTYTGNREDALDSIQDMTVKLFDNIRKLRSTDAFYSWSKTILVNLCKGMLRKKGRVIALERIPEEVYHENYSAREDRQDILVCLNSLSDSHQEAIKLRYFLDMDYDTIAKVTGVPVGTVKSRIFCAMAKLKELFGGDEGE
jgi:RNA polymerase sigma-70 factor (ECF subfamily)